MTSSRRHLVLGKKRKTACGLKDPPLRSSDPALVTCSRCHRSPQMADAELLKQAKNKQGLGPKPRKANR